MLSNWWRQTLGQWFSTGVWDGGVYFLLPLGSSVHIWRCFIFTVGDELSGLKCGVADIERHLVLEHICKRFDFEQITLALWRPWLGQESECELGWRGRAGGGQRWRRFGTSVEWGGWIHPTGQQEALEALRLGYASSVHPGHPLKQDEWKSGLSLHPHAAGQTLDATSHCWGSGHTDVHSSL